MVSENGVLYVHFFFAFFLVAGMFTALVLRLAAISYANNPIVIVALLRIMRTAVPVVIFSLIAVVCFGFWMAKLEDIDLSSNWLIAVYVLVSYMLIVGMIAGKFDRQTREMAEQVVANGSSESSNNIENNVSAVTPVQLELGNRLRDPRNMVLNASMFASVLVVIALMVFKPT